MVNFNFVNKYAVELVGMARHAPTLTIPLLHHLWIPPITRGNDAIGIVPFILVPTVYVGTN